MFQQDKDNVYTFFDCSCHFHKVFINRMAKLLPFFFVSYAMQFAILLQTPLFL